MKHIFLALLLICATWSFGQKAVSTDAHQQVPGTNISVVPPTDFQVSENFKGFQNPTDPTSMIMIVEVPGAFDQVSAGFNKEMLSTRGMVLKSKDVLMVNSQDALFIELEQDANGMTFTKSILIYGDANTSTLINGVCLKDSVVLAKQISESVRSASINAAIEVDPRAELAFTLDESVGDLQFVAVVSNGMFFNRDKKTPTESKDKATLIVDKSYADQDFYDQKAFCVNRLAKLPGNYELLSDKYPKKTTLAGIEGYELFALNADDEDEEIHLTILFEEDGGYYIFMGLYQTGAEQAKADIKAVMKTFSKR